MQRDPCTAPHFYNAKCLWNHLFFFLILPCYIQSTKTHSQCVHVYPKPPKKCRNVRKNKKLNNLEYSSVNYHVTVSKTAIFMYNNVVTVDKVGIVTGNKVLI